MITKTNLKKRLNTIMVKNAAPRLLLLAEEEPKDYRALSVALSSVPLDGQIAEIKMERDRQDAQRKPMREKEHLPVFDDIRW